MNKKINSFLAFTLISFISCIAIAHAEPRIECLVTNQSGELSKKIECSIYDNNPNITSYSLKMMFNQPLSDFGVTPEALTSETEDIVDFENNTIGPVNTNLASGRDVAEPFPSQFSIRYNDAKDVYPGVYVEIVTREANGTSYTKLFQLIGDLTIGFEDANTMFYFNQKDMKSPINSNKAYTQFRMKKANIDNNNFVAGFSANYQSDAPVTGVSLIGYNKDGAITDLSSYISHDATHKKVEFSLEEVAANSYAGGLALNFKQDTSNVSVDDVIPITLSNIKYVPFSDFALFNSAGTDLVGGINIVAESDYDLGDWNDDKEFNLVDLIRYRLYLASSKDITKEYSGFGQNKVLSLDLNDDGSVNLPDLILVRKLLVEIITFDNVGYSFNDLQNDIAISTNNFPQATEVSGQTASMALNDAIDFTDYNTIVKINQIYNTNNTEQLDVKIQLFDKTYGTNTTGSGYIWENDDNILGSFVWGGKYITYALNSETNKLDVKVYDEDDLKEEYNFSKDLYLTPGNTVSISQLGIDLKLDRIAKLEDNTNNVPLYQNKIEINGISACYSSTSCLLDLNNNNKVTIDLYSNLRIMKVPTKNILFALQSDSTASQTHIKVYGNIAQDCSQTDDDNCIFTTNDPEEPTIIEP